MSIRVMSRLCAITALSCSLFGTYALRAADLCELVMDFDDSGRKECGISDRWIITKPNNNYGPRRTEPPRKCLGPVCNPDQMRVMCPEIEEPQGTGNYVGVANPADLDCHGKLSHEAIELVPPESEFHLTICAHRGLCTGGVDPRPNSGVHVRFLGWGPGSLPYIRNMDGDWSRRWLVKEVARFTNWEDQSGSGCQDFWFNQGGPDLHYVTWEIAGTNGRHGRWVTFDCILQ